MGNDKGGTTEAEWRARAGIPARAVERVVQSYPDGGKHVSEFRQKNELVGRAYWNESGRPTFAEGLRSGRRSGHQLEFHDNGSVSYEQPFVDGLAHGWARQYSPTGRLILASPFKHGTGTDFWCDFRGRLAEEHPCANGRTSGCERWWADAKTIFIETYWLDGLRHGISRQWRNGKLDVGFPQFVLQGKRVSKSRYLAATQRDPRLVPYRPEDDDPRRELPKEFLRLKRLARRRGSK